MYKYCLWCLVSLILISSHLLAQNKIEREFAISIEEVPVNAKEFIYDSGILLEGTKVNWYREVGQNQESIEAKFKQQKRRFSIEFSTEGILLDAEIEIKTEEIPQRTLEQIKKTLGQSFSKWKWIKIQRQWLGEPQKVISSLKQKKRTKEITENYEIVIKGTKNDESGYWEVLFDDNGKAIRTSKIIQNSSDILIY